MFKMARDVVRRESHKWRVGLKNKNGRQGEIEDWLCDRRVLVASNLRKNKKNGTKWSACEIKRSFTLP